MLIHFNVVQCMNKTKTSLSYHLKKNELFLIQQINKHEENFKKTKQNKEKQSKQKKKKFYKETKRTKLK